jgi:peptidoglycan/xylan/chitin deacetylase (PgdA/CDA1 family)
MKPLILCYHGLGDVPRELDPHGLMVPPERFRAQVQAVGRRGYAFTTVAEFARRLHAGVPVAGLCAVSFDDGSADNVHALPPLLAELGVPATVYACPGLLGATHGGLLARAGVRLMDADELRALAADPWVDIGSHTCRHTDLSTATADEAYREMAASKEALEDLLGKPIESFAYPYCAYSPACPAAAERAGYVCAATCAPRGSLRPYELRREAILSYDNRLRVALKSRGVFHTVWNTGPMRVARALARPVRWAPGEMPEGFEATAGQAHQRSPT